MLHSDYTDIESETTPLIAANPVCRSAGVWKWLQLNRCGGVATLSESGKGFLAPADPRPRPGRARMFVIPMIRGPLP